MSCRRPRRDAGRGIPHQPCTHWHAESDADLLAERFDGDTDNLFALQDEITSRIAVALNLELTSRESLGQPIISTRGNYILGGRSAYWKPASRPRLVCRGWERPSAAVAKPMSGCLARKGAQRLYWSIARLTASGYAGPPNYCGVPQIRALFETTYFAGLRIAGIREE
jgi:hypothetical protein